VATTGIAFVGNLSADWTVPTAALRPGRRATYNMVKQSVVYDSLGTQHTVSQYFVKKDATNVSCTTRFDGAARRGARQHPDLRYRRQADRRPQRQPSSLPAVPAARRHVTIDYTGTTRFAGEATTTTNRNDGYPRAPSSAWSWPRTVRWSPSTATSNAGGRHPGHRHLRQRRRADRPTSDTSWTANADSGDALYTHPGRGPVGQADTGTLEGSNVDITSELVGLMTSQRNYQANSKVLSPPRTR
jgi:flagellar hook protein FlgE